MSPELYFSIAAFVFFVYCFMIGFDYFTKPREFNFNDIIYALMAAFFDSVCWGIFIPIGIIVAIGFGIAKLTVKYIKPKE